MPSTLSRIISKASHHYLPVPGVERASSGLRALVRAAAPAVIGYPADGPRLAGRGPRLQASADSSRGSAILA